MRYFSLKFFSFDSILKELEKDSPPSIEVFCQLYIFFFNPKSTLFQLFLAVSDFFNVV